MLRAKYQSELNKLKVEEKYMKLIASHLKDQINRLKVRNTKVRNTAIVRISYKCFENNCIS